MRSQKEGEELIGSNTVQLLELKRLTNYKTIDHTAITIIEKYSKIICNIKQPWDI